MHTVLQVLRFICIPNSILNPNPLPNYVCTVHTAARQRYFGVATLKDVFENVASRNIIAYVKDVGLYIVYNGVFTLA